MLLKALADYAQRIDPTPAMYGPSPVRWLISLTLEGQLRGDLLTPLGDKKNKRGAPKILPHINRSSGISPKLLADTGEYVLGIPKAKSKRDRIAQCHAQFKDLARLCAESTQLPVVEAIVKFLDGWEPERDRHLLPPDFDPSMVITFQVMTPSGPVIPAEDKAQLTAIQQFWANHTGGTEAAEHLGWCLVSGHYGPVQQRLPFTIKGVPGGQASGTALVSANSKAFESYGLANSLTSPISRDAGEAFAKALNHLLKDRDSHLRISDKAVYAWWTKEATGFDLFSLLDKPSDEQAQAQVKDLIAGLKKQPNVTALEQLEQDRFYALALTANNARTVVRSWLNITLAEVRENLGRWFRAQQVVSPTGEDPKLFGLYALAASTYRDVSKEMLPRMPTALFFAALQGKPLPDELLASVVRRIRVDQDHKMTHPRAAFIKLYLTFKEIIPMNETESMAELNLQPPLEGPDLTAYHCGRLLAQLEQIQRTALGKDINATLVDRYYGAMSTTPGKVMGVLIQGAQAHLSKIRKNQPGAHHNLQLQLEEIYSHIQPDQGHFPHSFTMQQQSIFALGYYHQRAHNNGQARSKKNQNKS
ncbi:type I-C CRISPR-associated protein Cas8c/Csd1 [Spirulina subsalsa FACHB-351]|uniref:Type I-C CRISPR-associated protein Cas8c/Csd1 n=1 Tax=Spirulina subsalsa FACHB-351 TaxID=234711 RepID=A0ABT3L6D2_9CYAN|nr:type I-C CRISPR-associated protein Cas8c/Csd1 [Spirulina subsalsa]MCW6037070.1 type I-C CRISPR-associated protein Cas8c/Csd1 [Spirulina subsalsa FACHB-351]